MFAITTSVDVRELESSVFRVSGQNGKATLEPERATIYP
jgi:hypothetical protein